jgi:FMN-dependent NADH-azoreductase
MATLLHIHASPRDESVSAQMAKAFFEEVRRLRPADKTVSLDLFKTDLLPFDAPAAKAKYAVLAGQTPQGQAEQTWAKVIRYVDQLKAADAVVLSAGMWNFSIPYRLKQYIDIIVQPGLTFKYSAQTGYVGLVTGKPITLLLARGGKYAPGTPTAAYDFQRPYLETIFRFIGFEDLRVALCESTLETPPEGLPGLVSQAQEQARALARQLCKA